MARITYYTLSTKADRTVCLDGFFQCPNPACRYASPYRAWGKGTGSNKITDTNRNLTMPGEMRMGVKRVAENQAWADAQRRFQMVRCPRCMGFRDPQVQFANM